MTAKKTRPSGGPFDVLRPLRDELQKKEQASPASKPRVPAPPVRSPNEEREDDGLLLRRLFAGVAPLDRTRGRMPKQVIERSPAVERVATLGPEHDRADADAVREHLRTLVEGRARFEVSDDGQRVEGRRLDFPLETVRKLRRGLFPIDARLDLHGMGTEQARAKMQVFLQAMRSRGERCILVIHGKGEHSPSGTGVLRGEMAAWLSQGTSSEHVTAFTTAQGSDGGEGAVYVLLRR